LSISTVKAMVLASLSRTSTSSTSFPMSEQVLVVRRSLFDRLGSFHGLNADIQKYLPVFLEPGNHFFVPRPEAEEDPSLKQLIPYVVVTAGERLLHYRRGSGSGEARLLKKGSVGIGGHINDGDGLGESFDASAYQRALMRELREELSIESCFIERPLALLNDDTNPVGAVHLGIVHQCHLAEPNVTANEEAIAELGFLTLGELGERHDQLETWSQLVIAGWKDLRTIGVGTAQG
jgi:predicted NUDIX family phosphoesterase